MRRITLFFFFACVFLAAGISFAGVRGGGLPSITDTGTNVGIGSVNPQGKLDVAGTIVSSGSTLDASLAGTNSYINLANDGTRTGIITAGSLAVGASNSIEIEFDGVAYPTISSLSGGVAFNSPVIFNYPGNFGIGTSAPLGKLQVDAALYDGSSALVIKTGYNATTKYITVDSVGNVGLGQITPTGAFTVASQDTLGWTVKYAANTACTTTCTAAAVMGYDNGTNSWVVVSASTADSCLCAGAN